MRKRSFAMFGAALLGTGAAALTTVHTTRAAVYTPPLVTASVSPDLGVPGRGHVVRIERFRRSSPGKIGVDTGLISYDVEIENTGTTPIELDKMNVSYTGQLVQTPPAQLDAFANADLMAHRGFGPTGTTIDDLSKTEWVGARAATTLGGKYVVAGTALVKGSPRLYVGQHALADGELTSEHVLDLGHDTRGHAIVALDETPSHPAGVIVGGEYELPWGTRALLARYTTNADGDLVPDMTFSAKTFDVPDCTNARITTMRVDYGDEPSLIVAGIATCTGGLRTFVARRNQHGNPDLSFHKDGIAILPSVKPAQAVGLEIRAEGDQRFIYVLDAAGTSCTDAATDCTARVTKLAWDGAVASTVNVALPETKAFVPVGLRVGMDGMFVAGTRFEAGTNARGVTVARVAMNGTLDPAYGEGGFTFEQLQGTATLARALTFTQGVPNGMTVAALAIAPGAQQIVLYRFDGTGQLLSAESNRQLAGDAPRPGAIIAANGYLIAGYEAGRTQLTRFRPDGRLDWRGIIDPGKKQKLRFPDDRELGSFPTNVRLALSFAGFGTPLTIDAKVVEDAHTMAFPGERTSAGYAWSAGGHHRLRDLHRGSFTQRHGYDFGFVRWDAAKQVWTKFRANVDGLSENETYEIWNREVRASFSGRIVSCWRAAVDNSNPPYATEFKTIPMPGGGNMFIIEAEDGTYRALYAHMRAGSVPESVCPNTCTTYDKNVPWTHPGQQVCGATLSPDAPAAYVTEGQLLGRVGNSGSSSGPHLHFHVEDEQGGVPVYFSEAVTDQRVPVAQQTGKVALEGEAAPAPPVSEDVTSLVWALPMLFDIKLP